MIKMAVCYMVGLLSLRNVQSEFELGLFHNLQRLRKVTNTVIYSRALNVMRALWFNWQFY